MSFDRTLWQATFTPHSVPPWPCPVCSDGNLALEKDTLLTRESLDSKRDRAMYPESWDPDWIHGYFTALFQCTRVDCLSPVVACGNFRLTHEQDDDGDMYVESCTPTHFNPALPLLRLPRGCTDAITSELNNAWDIYWNDPGACVNHIRNSIERLMDHVGIPPMPKLHHRIEAYQQQEPELAAHLMAIKWLGNSGSHGGDGLTREDVLDALPLLDQVLGEVFEMRTKELLRLREKLLEKYDPARVKKVAVSGAVASPAGAGKKGSTT